MSTRPTRTRKPPPLTYWEEYVETDAWYLKKLVEDVPEEEMQAALYDEDYTRGEDVMSGDEDEDDASCSEEDVDYELVEQEDIAISNGSDESDAEDSDSSILEALRVCVSTFVTRRRHTAWCWRQRHAADGIHMRCVHDGSVCDEPSKLPQAHARRQQLRVVQRVQAVSAHESGNLLYGTVHRVQRACAQDGEGPAAGDTLIAKRRNVRQDTR